MKSKFYKEQETVDQYIKMAQEHDGANIIEKLKPYLNKEDQILELGSGPGSDFKILSQDYSVIGSDYSDEFIKRLKALYPNEKFLNLDAITLSTDLNFNAIYSNKVLHHLEDEELQACIVRQAVVLRPNGIICHTFWKGNGTEDFNGMFVNNHKEEELKDLFYDLFEVLELQSYKEFEEGDSILVIAKKKN
ncbi:class I SAM-dependent methyltransferase [Labilibacter marinus]|uniref:class I SAM-dependent methyltransferase n=1 Tax=Labilibacter marinus TaxID=1477105 RepID=UPI00094FB8F3|nr:class I SAM-dependent methyltransferase [Labilibacter marinus]